MNNIATQNIMNLWQWVHDWGVVLLGADAKWCTTAFRAGDVMCLSTLDHFESRPPTLEVYDTRSRKTFHVVDRGAESQSAPRLQIFEVGYNGAVARCLLGAIHDAEEYEREEFSLQA